MDEATFNAAIEGTEKQYDVNCRQVSNGFALAGNIRYCQPGTSNVKVAQSFEAVAETGSAAAELISNFLAGRGFTA